jgi:hypothetical protein
MITSKIPQPKKPFLQLIDQKGNTQVIVNTVLSVAKSHKSELKDAVKDIPRSVDGLRQLWNFVKENIHYVEDKDNPLYDTYTDDIQVIQTPSMLWENRKIGGDCKSHTVFISSALHCMGINHVIRFVSYSSEKTVTHVYCHAVLDGKEYNMDSVYWGFDEEMPYKHKQDFQMSAQIYTVGSVGLTVNTLPNLISIGFGDVTDMSEGELLRHLKADKYEALAAISPANAAKYNALARDIRNNESEKNGVNNFLAYTQDKTRPAFRRPNEAVGNIFDDAWKKLMNWIVKGAEGFTPFFLYQFLPEAMTKGTEIAKRIAGQNKIIEWVLKQTGMSIDVLMQIIENGIIKKLKATPADIIDSTWNADENANVGFIDPVTLSTLLPLIIKAIETLVTLVQEIANLFKKDKEEIRQHLNRSNASDLVLLQQSKAAQKQAEGNNNVALVLSCGMVMVAGVFYLLKRK